MGTMRFRRLLPALACLVFLASGTASASVDFSIGIGTYIGGYPGWPGDYCYVGIHRPWHWHPYRPWWPYYPPVVIAPPVVVRERHVLVEEAKLPPAPIRRPEPLSEELQKKRSELLRVLRIGDTGHRLSAVQELAPFADAASVRTSLERALRSDRDPQVRRAVAELFGRLEDSKALPALKQAYAEDTDRDVRQAAYKAIIMIEGYPLDSD